MSGAEDSRRNLYELLNLPVNKPVLPSKLTVLPEDLFLNGYNVHINRQGDASERRFYGGPLFSQTVGIASYWTEANSLGNDTAAKGADMSLSREEIDAKLERTEARIEAVEARMETKLEQAINEVKTSNADLKSTVEAFVVEMRTEFKSVPRMGAMVITAATFFVATVGAIVAILSFGGDRFDGGVQLTSTSVEQAIDAKQLGQQNAEQLRALTTAVEAIATDIQSLKTQPVKPSPPAQQ